MEQAEDNTSSTANIVAFLWLVSLVIVGFLAYFIGKGSAPSQQEALVTLSPTPPPVGGPTSSALPTIGADLESICDITGPSQKKDYLKSYILKEGDNFQSIAEKELSDPERVSELTTLNGDQKNLMVGSTIYLPPDEIKESSGNLAEVSGKLVKKDNASWQLAYGGGTQGPGIVIPGFWFKDLSNTTEFAIGDCITVFLDNGVKVFSVTKN